MSTNFTILSLPKANKSDFLSILMSFYEFFMMPTLVVPFFVCFMARYAHSTVELFCDGLGFTKAL